jgi:hypothetical protein
MQTNSKIDGVTGKICWIGETVTYKGTEVVVVDTDMLNGEAKIGVPDTNGIVWDTSWVSWDFISKNKTNTYNK